MTVPLVQVVGVNGEPLFHDKEKKDPFYQQITLRVGGITLYPGDEIPPEFEALAPESWKQTGTKQPKIKAAETVEDIR